MKRILTVVLRLDLQFETEHASYSEHVNEALRALTKDPVFGAGKWPQREDHSWNGTLGVAKVGATARYMVRDV